MLEGAPAPLIRGLGAEMGRATASIHAQRGRHPLRRRRSTSSRADGVRLADGESVPADVIVVGIGVTPATDWLDGSGLELRDGVVCDATLCAGAPGVYAAGDVARWPNELFGEEMRVEHWTNAAEQGAAAARNLLAAAAGDDRPAVRAGAVLLERPVRPPHPVPRPRGSRTTRSRSSSARSRSGKFLALYGRDGRLRGALGVNAPRLVMPYRTLLARAGRPGRRR